MWKQLKKRFGKQFQKLNRDETALCEIYFEDDPTRGTSDIAEEFGVDPRAVNLAKAAWRNRNPERAKALKPRTQERTMSSELNRFVKMKEDVEAFQKAFGGGGEDEYGIAAILNAANDLLENPTIISFINQKFSVNIPPEEEVIEEEITMTKEERIREHVKALQPYKDRLTPVEILKEIDKLSPNQREGMKAMYETVEDLQLLAKGLDLTVSDKDLEAILEKIQGPPKEEPPEEIQPEDKPKEKPPKKKDKEKTGGEDDGKAQM